jgi:hypothetical protein
MTTLSYRKPGEWFRFEALLPQLIFVLGVVGYPIIALFAIAISVDSQSISISFRIFIAVLSVIVILMHIKKRTKPQKLFLFVYLFLFIYLLRLLIDTFEKNIIGADYALHFFVGAILLPCIAIRISVERSYQLLPAILIHSLGTAISAISLYFQYSGLGLASNLTDLTGRLSFDTLNPITLGHVSLSALISGYYLLTLYPGIRMLSVFSINSIICFVCILEVGSKGPMLGLLLVIIYIVMLKLQTAKIRWSKFNLARSLFIGCILFGVTAAYNYSNVIEGSSLLLRWQESELDDSTVFRIGALLDAIDQANSNPFFGSAFIELNSGEYPHNLIVESFMALGFPAGLLFCWLILFVLKYTFTPRDKQNMLTKMLFLQYFTGAMFSGALYGSQMFWMTLILLFHGAQNTNKMEQSSSAQRIRWARN